MNHPLCKDYSPGKTPGKKMPVCKYYRLNRHRIGCCQLPQRGMCAVWADSQKLDKEFCKKVDLLIERFAGNKDEMQFKKPL